MIGGQRRSGNSFLQRYLSAANCVILANGLWTMFCCKIEGRSQIAKCCKFLNYLEFFFCRNILIFFPVHPEQNKNTTESFSQGRRAQSCVHFHSVQSTLITMVVQCIHSLFRPTFVREISSHHIANAQVSFFDNPATFFCLFFHYSSSSCPVVD